MACQDMERALCPSFLYAVLLSLILGLTLLPPKPRNVAIDAIPSSDNSSVFAGRVCLLPPSSYSPLSTKVLEWEGPRQLIVGNSDATCITEYAAPHFRPMWLILATTNKRPSGDQSCGPFS